MAIGKILVADDHAITRCGLLSMVHEIFGDVEVAEAGDSQSVVENVAQGDWDLILLDMMMPGGMDILEVLGRIRKVNAEVPILVITAEGEASFAVRSIKAGANGLINKHLPPDELVRAIEKVAQGGTYLHADVAAAIARCIRDDEPLPHERLSERELEILKGLAMGRAVKEVAADLAISDKTVATYIARIRQKTGLANAVEMARYAMQHDLVN
ncbi:response regulator [Novosphingobium pentaromativorans]|uniref:Two-component system, NarL family, response regulator, fimbrial Z protein, FimZ n=1 Tax=Novosphingobium pentaromativorans US6-1 TaxID=1088721 RepID=G6EI38_9SPHN|nr:response regulator transcription factor [Novosphingobium pentaromativorans]AIT78670.1 fimbrial protein [Novosphingobium pentaromativorans US6-1]EHJ59026.1 two-component system, NarL family, response regulator, fimbrial Z protein, FimZ [Novosphingobium pentaromativorans US6-1]